MTELFATLIALTLSGAAYGMVLYLVASGLSLLIGLTRILHLGHAAFALIGGATASYLHTALGLTFINSTVLGMFAAMAVALVAERAMIRQLDRRAPMQHVAASLGLAFLTIAVVSLLFGTEPLPLDTPPEMMGEVSLWIVEVPARHMITIIIGLGAYVALTLLLTRTRFGIAFSATRDDPATAAALGINTGRVYMRCALIAAGYAALGGALGTDTLPIDAFYPIRYLALFLAVAVIGGFRTTSGTLLAALGVGLLDEITRLFLPEQATLVYLAVLILLLSLRPQLLPARA